MVKRTAASSPLHMQSYPLIGPLALETFNSGKNVCVNFCLLGPYGSSRLASMEIRRSGHIIIQPCLDLALARAVESTLKLVAEGMWQSEQKFKEGEFFARVPHVPL